MFIDRNTRKWHSPFGGAEMFLRVPVYLSSAPPNGEMPGCDVSVYKHLTPTE